MKFILNIEKNYYKILLLNNSTISKLTAKFILYLNN